MKALFACLLLILGGLIYQLFQAEPDWISLANQAYWTLLTWLCLFIMGHFKSEKS